jgi:hypothetical protein
MSPGCLVLGLQPFYVEKEIIFNDQLLGQWHDVDDNVTVTVEKSDWRSYRIKYVHPTESGGLTAYLVSKGKTLYLDLTPLRGQDFGSFIVPGHALVKLSIGAQQITVTPLSYDYFKKGLAGRTLPAALAATTGERDQIILGASRESLSQWLAARPSPDPAFGPGAVFKR